MVSVARQTLARARILLAQAADAGEVWERFATNYEAAVVFARSVTFHLHAEYANKPGFRDWYARRRETLDADDTSRYFLDTRNSIVHEGPVALTQVGSVMVQDSGVGTDSASVSRGAEDDPLESANSEYSGQLAVLERLRHMEEVPGTATFSYHLLDRLADERDAVELLSQHLDTLSALVAEAATKWDPAP